MPAKNHYLRTDTWQIKATIDGKDFGVFEGRTGGAGDSEETKLRLGGMGAQVSLGGAQTLENITLRKLWDGMSDFSSSGNDVVWLYARRGKAEVTCTNQPLDQDGNIYAGKKFTFTGILKQVTVPDYDAQGNEGAFLELEVATDGNIA